VLNTGDPYNLQVAVSVETAVEPRGNLMQFQSVYYALKEFGSVRL
jgi:hypothetical protein